MKAQRINVDDEQVLTSYTVSFATRHNNLTLHSFPDDLWEMIANDSVVNINEEDEDLEAIYIPDPDWLDTLGSEDTEFAIEYIYSHTVTDDGSLFIDLEVVAFVDETRIPLPEERPINTSYMPETESMSLDQEAFDEFNKLFSPTDMNSFNEIGRTVLAEVDPTNVIKNLYSEIGLTRFMGHVSRVNSMRNIASQLFPELLQEDI